MTIQTNMTELPKGRINEGFVVKSGEARHPGGLGIFGDQVFVKLSSADTDGNLATMEILTDPRCGPPLHRHTREDESFYVIEGEFRFEVDGKEMAAGPGSLVFAPRNTVHTYQNVGKIPGRMVVTVQPAGCDTFFTELAEATRGMAEPDHAVVVPIFEKYGLELLGPPLSARPPLSPTH